LAAVQYITRNKGSIFVKHGVQHSFLCLVTVSAFHSVLVSEETFNIVLDTHRTSYCIKLT